MEPITTTYYCVKTAVSIGKFALDYKKTQSLNNLYHELSNLSIINESIKDYIGLIRQDIQSMMHMYFKSAYENLNFAINASPNCKREYLIQARNRFIDACVIENNDNLILSYLGLSLCQKLLEDTPNSLDALNRIKAVDWIDIYSNNLDDYWKGDFTWWQILLKISIKSISFSDFYREFNAHDVIDNELSWRYGKVPSIEDRKYVYHRRLDAIKTCGGISLTEKEFHSRCVNAEKLILKEDFYRLKREVIESFNL